MAAKIGQPIKTQYKSDETKKIHQPTLTRYQKYFRYAKNGQDGAFKKLFGEGKDGDFASIMFYAVSSDKSIKSIKYAYYDVNRDGRYELLLSTATDGASTIYGLRGSNSVHLLSGSDRLRYLSIYKDATVCRFNYGLGYVI